MPCKNLGPELIKKVQARGGDGLVPGSYDESRKAWGRGRPRPFLESALILVLPKYFQLERQVATGITKPEPESGI